MLMKLTAGRSNCEWSSCEEGCTKTIFTCWQIEVDYVLPGVEVGPGSKPPKRRGRLFPNVKVKPVIVFKHITLIYFHFWPIPIKVSCNLNLLSNTIFNNILQVLIFVSNW